MEIIEYEDKYIEDARNLLVELEEYIVSIDKDNLDHVGEDYREKYIINLKENTIKNDGKIYLALEEGKVVGLVAGIIRKYSQEDYLDYKCPKTGVVEELVVTQEVRAHGVGKKLMKKIEEYFKEKGCQYSYLDVFAYNKNAKNFYSKTGYHARMHGLIKKLD